MQFGRLRVLSLRAQLPLPVSLIVSPPNIRGDSRCTPLVRWRIGNCPFHQVSSCYFSGLITKGNRGAKAFTKSCEDFVSAFNLLAQSEADLNSNKGEANEQSTTER